MKQRTSIRTKLLIGVLAILAPVFGLLVYDFQTEYARHRVDVLNGLTRTGQTIAVLTDTSFDEALALARTLADDPVLQTLDRGALDPYLARLIRYRPDLNNLAVADAEGNLAGTAVPPSEPVEVADRRYFQEVMETGRPALSDVIFGRVSRRAVVVAAAPIPGPGGRPIGVTIVSVRLDVLADSLASVGLRTGQAIFLTDQTGRLALDTARPDVAFEERDISSWPEVQAALAGQTVEQATFRNPQSGDVQATAFVPTPKHGWVVGIGWSVSQAFGPAEQAHNLQLAAFAAIVLLSLAGAALLAAYLAAPVRQLAGLARALGHGELTRRAEVRTGDELQQLAETFNTMAAQLQWTIEQLQETSGQLKTALKDREKALKLREEFIAAAAHELRTPSTSLKGYVGVLRRLPEPQPLVVGKAIGAIEHSADRIARLAQGLVDAAELEGGTLRLETARFDLAELAREVVEAVRAEDSDHHFRLTASPVLVTGDREKLGQVIRYLLDNAAKYQPSAEPIDVTVSVDRGQAVLSVRDLGPGIPADRQPHVFEPLFEPLPPGALGYVGVVGLGLGVSQGLIELHQGRIWLESESGRGSTFSFSLPVSPPETANT